MNKSPKKGNDCFYSSFFGIIIESTCRHGVEIATKSVSVPAGIMVLPRLGSVSSRQHQRKRL
jgi:hypothetical protein